MMKKLYVEITNACNLRCSFCPPTTRPPEFLSAERFERLLARVGGKAELLYFHLKGEPLLHPELGRLLDLAAAAGFPVAVTTNGTLLPERLEDLAEKPALARLNISLHSLPEAACAEPDRAAAAGMLESILGAAAELRRRDPERRTLKTISLRLWNRGDEAETGGLLTGIERFFALPEGSLAAALANERGTLVAPGLSVHPAERFDWPRLEAEGGQSSDGVAAGDRTSARGYCRGLRDQAGILVDGTVVPCCLDGEGDVALGNIYASSWEDIMASPRSSALKEGFSERRVVEPLCRTCGYRKRFDKPSC